MDFKSMKRKELQALCKKHGLPANSTNVQMVKSLASFFAGVFRLCMRNELLEQAQEKIKPRGCLKGSGGSSGEDGGRARVGSKKVCFSFHDEKPEFEGFRNDPDENRLPERRRSSRRRSIIEVEPESLSEGMEKEKGAYEKPTRSIDVPARTTRSRGRAAAVVWSPVIEKKARKETGSIRGNGERPQDGDLDRENDGDTSKWEKEVSAVEPTTRSLRHRVVVGGNAGVAVHPNVRRTQRKNDVAVMDEDDGTKMAETSCQEPMIRSLRHRVVVVEGNAGAARHVKPRSTQRKKGGSNNEDVVVVAPFTDRDKRDLRKRQRGATALADVSTSEQVEKAPVYEDPPPRRSKRSVRNPKASVSEVEKLAIDEDGEICKSRDLRKGVKESQDAAGVEEKDEHESVAGKKSEKQGRNRVKRREARAVSEPEMEALTNMTAADVQEGSQRLLDVKGPMRRSTRKFSEQNVVDHGTAIHDNLHDDNFVSRNSTMRMQDKLHRRNGSRQSLAAISETETASSGLGIQVELQSAMQIKEAPRRSRRNALKSNAPDDVFSMPAAGKSGHIGERVARDRSSKRQRTLLSEIQGVETSEVHQQLAEPPRRSTRHTSTSRSLAVPALKTVSEELVGRQKPNKRRREVDFDGDVAAVEREVGDRSHPSEDCNRSLVNRCRKTFKRVAVDDEVLQDDFFPLPSPSLFEDLHEDIKGRYLMQKSCDKKEFSHMRAPDASGQKTDDVHHGMEDTTLKSESNGEKAAYVYHSCGLQTGVSIDKENNASKLRQPLLVDNVVSGQSSVEQLQQIGDGISLDGAWSGSVEDMTGCSSGIKAKHYNSAEVTHDVQEVCLSELVESSQQSTEKEFGEVPFSRVEAVVEVEQSAGGASEGKLSMNDIGFLPSQVDRNRTSLQASIQGKKAEVEDPQHNKSTLMPDNCSNLLNTLYSEDDHEGNVVSDLPLSFNDAEQLPSTTVTEAISKIHPEEPAMFAEIKDASKMAPHINGYSSAHASDNDDQTVVLCAEMNQCDSGKLSDLQNVEDILSSQLTHEEPGITKDVIASVLVDDDSQSCKIVPIEVNKSSSPAGLLRVSMTVGSRTGVGRDDSDKNEADRTQSLLCDDNQVQGLASEEFSKGGGLGIGGSSCHSSMKSPDPLDLSIAGRELSFLQGEDKSCKTEETSKEFPDCSYIEGNIEWTGNSRGSLHRKLDEDNENTASPPVNSFKSDEQEETLEMRRKDTEFLLSKSRKLSSEIMGDISERTECTVSKVTNTIEGASEGELHVDHKDTVLQPIFDSGTGKQSMTREVVPQVVDAGSTMPTIPADGKANFVNVLQDKGSNKSGEVESSIDVPLSSSRPEESLLTGDEVPWEIDHEESFKQADIDDNGQMTCDISNCSSVSPGDNLDTGVENSSSMKNHSKAKLGFKTMLVSDECAMSKHEDFEEYGDSGFHLSSPENVEESLMSSFSLSDTKNEDVDAHRGNGLDGKKVHEFRHSRAQSSPFDQFSSSQVQEYGDEVSYKEITLDCLGSMTSRLSNKEHPHLKEKKFSYDDEYLMHPQVHCNKLVEQPKVLQDCIPKVHTDEICIDHTGAVCVDLCKENKNLDFVVKGIAGAENLSDVRNTEATPPVDTEKLGSLFKTPGVKTMHTADACSSVLITGSLDCEAGGPVPEKSDTKNHILAHVVVSVDHITSRSASEEFKAVDILQDSVIKAHNFQISHSSACQSFLEGSNLQPYKEDLEEIKETHAQISVDKVSEVSTDESALEHSASYIVGSDPTRRLDGLQESANSLSEDLDDEFGKCLESMDKVACEMENMETSECAEESEGKSLANMLYKCHAEVADNNVSSDILVSQLDWRVSDGAVMSEENEAADEMVATPSCDVFPEADELELSVTDKKELAETSDARQDKPLLSSVGNQYMVPTESASIDIIPVGRFDCQAFKTEENVSYEGNSRTQKHEEVRNFKEDSITTRSDTCTEELDCVNCQDGSRREETIVYNASVIMETMVATTDYNADNCGKSSSSMMEQDATTLIENETKWASHAARQSQFYLQDFCLNSNEKSVKGAMDHVTPAQNDCKNSAAFERKQYYFSSCETPEANKGLDILSGQLNYKDHEVAELGENRDSVDVSENTSSPEAHKQHEVNENTRSEEMRCNLAEGRHAEQTALNDGHNVEGAAFLPTSSDKGTSCKGMKSINGVNAGDECNCALVLKSLELDEEHVKIDDNYDSFAKAQDVPTSRDIGSDFDSLTPDKSFMLLRDLSRMDSGEGMGSESVQSGSKKHGLKENLETTESEGFAGTTSTTTETEATADKKQVENIESISDIVDEKVEEEDNIHAKREPANLESENPSQLEIRSDSDYGNATNGLESEDFDLHSKQKKSCQDVNSLDTSRDGKLGEVCPGTLAAVLGNELSSPDGFKSVVEQGNLISETVLDVKILMNEKECDSDYLENNVGRESKSQETSLEGVPSCTVLWKRVHEVASIDPVASIARAAADVDKPKSDDDAEAGNSSNLTVLDHQSCNRGCGSLRTVLSTLGMSSDNSPKSELGVYGTSEVEKSNGTHNLEQMEQISHRLMNFRISSARKTSRLGFEREPTKLVSSFKHQALICETKGKENTPIVKTAHSSKHNVEKLTMTNLARRPLRSVDKNNK